MESCALCSAQVTQYVRVNDDQVFCLPDVVTLLQQSYDGGYLEGHQVTTLAEFWQVSHDTTFSSIGY